MTFNMLIFLSQTQYVDLQTFYVEMQTYYMLEILPKHIMFGCKHLFNIYFSACMGDLSANKIWVHLCVWRNIYFLLFHAAWPQFCLKTYFLLILFSSFYLNSMIRHALCSTCKPFHLIPITDIETNMKLGILKQIWNLAFCAGDHLRFEIFHSVQYSTKSSLFIWYPYWGSRE